MKRLCCVAVALSLTACSAAKSSTPTASGTPSTAAPTSAAARSAPATVAPSSTVAPSPSTVPASPSGTSAATHSAPGGPPSTSKSAIRDLKAQLIWLDDLPAFWAADQAGKGNAKDEPACFATFDKLAQRPVTHAEASFFLDHHSRAELFENIGYVTKRPAANFRQVVKALDHCAGPVSSLGAGPTLTGTIGPMAFPALGDDSKAYQMVLFGVVHKVRVGVGVDVLLLRVGGEEMTLMYTTGGGAPQTQDFQAVVKLAYDKIGAAIGGGGTTI